MIKHRCTHYEGRCDRLVCDREVQTFPCRGCEVNPVVSRYAFCEDCYDDDDDSSGAADHEAQHARGRVDARVCQGVGCPRGDA